MSTQVTNLQSTKVTLPRHIKRPWQDWEFLISTEDLLKAYQNFFEAQTFNKKRKGSLIEGYLIWYFCQKGFELKYKNKRTPFGEIDFVLTKGSAVYVFESKLDLKGKLDPFIWSSKQRIRFYKSIQYLYLKKAYKLLALVRRDKVLLKNIDLIC